VPIGFFIIMESQAVFNAISVHILEYSALAEPTHA
jgi:hypothetical protein